MEDSFSAVNDSALKQQLSDDTILYKVNKHFISLQREEVKENNRHLQEATDDIINKMRAVNSLFDKTYQNMFFGGSFYKKTKVSNPTEFDLNMVIKLPFKETNIRPGPPGFIQLHLPSGFNFTNYDYAEQKTLKSFVTYDGVLNQKRFRAWIEGTLAKTIAQLPQIKMIKSGPAFTLSLEIDDEVTIDIDLVPVLQFDKRLPNDCVDKDRLSKCVSKTWLAVPKPLNNPWEYLESNDLYWRLSFYEQEKQILSQCGRTKLLIRLMKKLRDTEEWYGLKSYYIENLFLYELETMEADFNSKPLTLLFYMMLHKLLTACIYHEINFYWNENCNLLSNMNPKAIDNMANRLYKIINHIRKSIGDDKYIIAKYIRADTYFHVFSNIRQIIYGEFKLLIFIVDSIEYTQFYELLNAPYPESGNAAEEKQQEEWSCRIL